MGISFTPFSRARRLNNYQEYFVFNSYWHGNVTFDTSSNSLRLARVQRWEKLAFKSSRMKIFTKLMDDMLFRSSPGGNIISHSIVFDEQEKEDMPSTSTIPSEVIEMENEIIKSSQTEENDEINAEENAIKPKEQADNTIETEVKGDETSKDDAK